jgi:hypothetical protein
MAGHLDKSLPLEYQEEQSRLNILGFWIFLGAEIALRVQRVALLQKNCSLLKIL